MFLFIHAPNYKQYAEEFVAILFKILFCSCYFLSLFINVIVSKGRRVSCLCGLPARLRLLEEKRWTLLFRAGTRCNIFKYVIHFEIMYLVIEFLECTQNLILFYCNPLFRKEVCYCVTCSIICVNISAINLIELIWIFDMLVNLSLQINSLLNLPIPFFVSKHLER